MPPKRPAMVKLNGDLSKQSTRISRSDGEVRVQLSNVPSVIAVYVLAVAFLANSFALEVVNGRCDASSAFSLNTILPKLSVRGALPAKCTNGSTL